MRTWFTKVDNTAPAESGQLPAAEENPRGYELNNAVTTAGLTLDAYNVGSDTNLYMLAEALARYASGGVFGVDTGAINAYVIGASGSFIMPKAYFDGMMVIFYPGATNTGASTVNVNSYGAVALVDHSGVALVGGELVSGRLTAIIYNSSSGKFRLCPWANVVLLSQISNTVLTNL